MSNYWAEKFAETGADGVDFVPLIAKPWDIKTIYDSRTKKEMLAGVAYPRSNYFFWKIVNGEKQYIVEKKNKCKPGEVPVHSERTPVFLIIDTDNGVPAMIVTDRVTAEEMCLSLTEQDVYEMACDLYTWHHHWSMERAAEEAWRRCYFNYLIYEDSVVEFTPF